MAENTPVLKNEIDTDPLGRGYSGMSDVQVATDLNTEYRNVQAFVTADQVRQYLITQLSGTGVNQRSSLDMIREFAEAGTVRGGPPSGNAPDARRSGAQMIWYMLQREDTDARFPVDDANIRTQFIAIGPDGGNGPSVLTAAQLAALDALAIRTISRAEELNIYPVAVGHVQMARSA